MISSTISRSSRRADAALSVALHGLGALVVTLGALVLIFVALEAWPALRALGGRLLGDDAWHPSAGAYDLSPMLWGSLAVTALAIALATPLALLVAIFHREIAPPQIARVSHAVLGVLAGTPSVVLGLWGLTVLAPRLALLGDGPGTNLTTAALVLALMILPTVTLTIEASLAGVPGEVRRSALALGLSSWTTLRHIVLPLARRGIAAGVLLGCARALGETMVVLMVAGNVPQTPHGLLAPIRTITANIALEAPYAQGLHRSALFAGALGLLVVGLALVAAAARGQGHRAS